MFNIIIAEISGEQGTHLFTYMDNPVAVDDHTNHLEQRNCPVPIHIALHTAASDHRNLVMDCSVLYNLAAPRHDLSTENHISLENNDLETHSASIVIEALQSTDHQDMACCYQCNASGNYSNQESNLAISEGANSKAASVCTSNEQCNVISKPCGPQQATSPGGTLTEALLPGNERYVYA